MEPKVENDMSAKEQLRKLEAALKERGVVDVKFFFDHNKKPLTTGVVSEVTEMLDAMVNDRFDTAPRFRDSARA